jgi:hypothetical protein
MKFCPVCLYEIDEDISICESCLLEAKKEECFRILTEPLPSDKVPVKTTTPLSPFTVMEIWPKNIKLINQFFVENLIYRHKYTIILSAISINLLLYFFPEQLNFLLYSEQNTKINQESNSTVSDGNPIIPEQTIFIRPVAMKNAV